MATRAPSNAFSRWRWQRRLLYEARHLTKEAERILRKYGTGIPGEIRTGVEGGTAALHQAIARRAYEDVEARAEALDTLLGKHLQFARKSPAREYGESISIAVIIALLLRAFVVEAFKIPSGSMIPTLEVGDHIFVNKFIYGLRLPLTNIRLVSFGSPKRGDVVVFVYPQDESKDFIKRVVAVGGDRIEVKQNVIYLNEKPISRRLLPGSCIYSDEEEGSNRYEPRHCVAWEEEQDGTRYRVIQDRNGFPMDRGPWIVPEGHIFVMGDNRDNSHDSRYWGTVPGNYVKGKAMIIWWSSGEPDGVRWRRFFNLVHAVPEAAPTQP